jgi:hypothetical protein
MIKGSLIDLYSDIFYKFKRKNPVGQVSPPYRGKDGNT